MMEPKIIETHYIITSYYKRVANEIPKIGNGEANEKPAHGTFWECFIGELTWTCQMRSAGRLPLLLKLSNPERSKYCMDSRYSTDKTSSNGWDSTNL